jgi:hypothetical protein
VFIVLHRSRLFAARFVIAAGLAGLLLAGCQGSKHPTVYPVTGELFVKGQPAAGARLTLSPAENPDPALWKMGYPIAIVQPDGKFAFTSYEPDDGAPPGNYKLIASWLEGDTGVPSEDPDAPPLKALLDAKYNAPDTTPWTVVVEPKSNRLTRFEVP